MLSLTSAFVVTSSAITFICNDREALQHRVVVSETSLTVTGALHDITGSDLQHDETLQSSSKEQDIDLTRRVIMDFDSFKKDQDLQRTVDVITSIFDKDTASTMHMETEIPVAVVA